MSAPAYDLPPDAGPPADALAEPGESIPHEKLLAEYADVLAAHPDE